MEPIEVIAPEGTVVNAIHPASVAGGNVETSQRIVDVLFKALAQALPEQDSGGEPGNDEQPDDWRHRSAHRRTSFPTMKPSPAAWARDRNTTA